MTGYVFELTQNLVQTFVMTAFLSAFFGCKYEGAKRNIGFICAWLIVFAEISFINKIVLYDGLLSGISILTFFVYALLFLNGTVYMKAFISVFSMAFVFVIASVMILIGSCLSGLATSHHIGQFDIWRFVLASLCRVIEIVVFGLIVHIKNEYVLSKKEWFLFVSMPFMVWITTIILTNASLAAPQITLYMMLAELIVLLVVAAIYYFMLRINKDTQARLRIKILEQQNSNAFKSIKDAESYVNEMRSVKHNIENQLITIYNYIDKNKNDEAKAYINTLTKEYLPGISSVIQSGNDAFDAIVGMKKTMCENDGIDFKIKINSKALKLLNIIDTGVLFGNLIDNAIEAAEKSKDKKIVLEISEKGEYLSILLSNSIDESVLESNANLETTKTDKEYHGIGVKNIKGTVMKYDGMIQYYEENSMFFCHILFEQDRLREAK